VREPVSPSPEAALLVIMVRARYRPVPHHTRDGFLGHAFAISPWLGAIVVALIVLGGLLLALVKTAGRVLDGTPWYVRLALLVTAALGVSRLFKAARAPVVPGPPNCRRPTT
jgi:hypothetical protein